MLKRKNTMKARLLWACCVLGLVACGGDPSAKEQGEGGRNQGGSGGSISIGGGSGGGGATNPISDACVTDTAEARLTPLDIALAVDTSYSMDFEAKWQSVSGALLTFASAPRYKNLGVALEFFPELAQCSVGEYAVPAVPMTELPGAEAPLRSAVAGQRMAGGTPLVQVLSGMGGYVKTHASQHVDRRAVLVLATDGIPDDTCSGQSFTPPNSLANAATMARQLAEGTPGIPVFVIGVGSELAALDQIAQAGGTERAILVEVGSDTNRKFLDALDGIRKRSLACEYTISAPSAGEINFAAVNVRFTEAGREPETFVYVPNAAACGDEARGSWHYDNAAAPTKIVLCPNTCSRVSSATEGRIDTVFGCKRNDIVE
jgi:hypothetical protein